MARLLLCRVFIEFIILHVYIMVLSDNYYTYAKRHRRTIFKSCRSAPIIIENNDGSSNYTYCTLPGRVAADKNIGRVKRGPPVRLCWFRPDGVCRRTVEWWKTDVGKIGRWQKRINIGIRKAKEVPNVL